MKVEKFFLYFLFFPIVCWSQNVRHLSVNDGLPQSFVSDLIVDAEGFVWMSTRNGLARYDGHVLKTLQHIPDNENSLASNIISKLQKGEDNTLWVLYETNEIDLVDLNTGSIHHIFTSNDIAKYKTPISVRGCVIDRNKKLWHFFDNETVLSYEINNPDKKRSSEYTFVNDTVRSIFYDRKENVWVFSQKGLNKFNEKLNKFELINNPYAIHFNINFDNEKDIDNGISDLNERKNGELMWSDQKFLYFFNPTTTTFRRIKLPPELKRGPKQIQTGPDGKDYFIVNNKIYSYDDLTGLVLRGEATFGNNRLQEKEIEILAFLIDQSGLIWVAVNADGVYQIDLNIDFETFKYKDDFAITVLEKHFNVSLKDFFNFDVNRKGTLLPAYYLRSIKQEGNIWIAINRTVARYDTANGTLIKFKEIPLLSSEDFVPIKGITINKEGDPLVIDQNSNLYSLDIENNEWTIHSSAALLQDSFDTTIKPSGLIAENNLIWITTEFDGLICIDEINNKLTHLKKGPTKNSLPTNNLINIIPDINDREIFWIASYYGLLKFNKNTFDSKLFSLNEGLPDNTIYTILADKKGYLWLGTNKGLCKFNTKTFNHRTYTVSHGLSFMEYNRYHQFILPNGDFVLGGINEGVLFDPLKIKEDQFNPSIAITHIKVNNEEYKNKTDGFLQYNKVEKMTLPYYENNLSIEFSALEFSQPGDIRYRYRLNGYDNNWVVSNGREAVYTKIPYGEYILELNATNTSGTWSNKIKTLSIGISPPWWSTNWAIFLYVVLSITAIYLFINRRIKQKVIKKEIELKRKEANHFREINKIKTKFFTNMTHELRTPLSLIIAPVEQLKHTKKKKHQKRLLRIIKRNANNLLNLSDQLLDISKLEAGVLEPNYFQGDIILSIRKSIGAFKEEAKEKSIKIDIISPLTAYYIYSPYLLERIINNLISNSIKYGVEGGSITINLLESENGVIIKIEDNGIGIPQKDLPHVFERFYQADLPKDQSNVTGSGIGLSLVYELIKLQNGEIKVESETGNNSRTIFTIQLPYEKIKNLSNLKSKNKNQDTLVINKNKDLPTVLIVEDNQETLDFLSISLKSYYRIITSENGTKGLKLATEIIPDIIISDIMMPNMDGLELCKSLKENIITNHIPIILLTAKTELKSRLKGLSIGADDYISKPFSVSELVLRIKNRIEIQEKQRETIYEELKLLPHLTEERSQNERKDAFLIQIDEIIEEHLDDEQFGVNDLAFNLNMSRTSLHRKIKALTNISTGKIIQIYRLKRASSFLKEGYNISEVSYKTGFGSPSYFTKCFKETYSLTPSEYIENKSVKQ